MGRGKLPMEYIAKEKARKSSFKKRKEGLVKKIKELSILCGIDACMIIYGPQSDDGVATEVHTWPKERKEMESILKKYEMKRNESSSKHSNLVDYFGNQTCKINEQIAKTKREIAKARFTKSLEFELEGRTANGLNAMLVDVDKKTESVKSRIEAEKEKQKMSRGLGMVEMMKFDDQQTQESDLNKIVMASEYCDHQSYLGAQATENLKHSELSCLDNYNGFIPLQCPSDIFLTHGNYPSDVMTDYIPTMMNGDNGASNFGQFQAQIWEPQSFQTSLYGADALKNYGMGYQLGTYPAEQQQSVLTSVLLGNCFQSGSGCCCCVSGACFGNFCPGQGDNNIR